jgi:hypothetical protein
MRSFLALVAAPVLLVSASASPALADSSCASECNFVVTPADIPSECTVEFTGGCSAQCTPGSFVAQCDGSCNVDAEASCTGTCEGSCMTQCQADPGSFDCSGQCDTDCEASCSDSDCEADCKNRCDVQCSVVPPSATCETQCQASCNASCQVQVNIDCHENCVASVAPPECTAACSEPAAAIFCNGQFVSVSEATSCVDCLETNGLSLNASVSCSGGQCVGSAGVCSATAAVGSSEDRWGVFGITGLVVGLGLLASRRRKSA